MQRKYQLDGFLFPYLGVGHRGAPNVMNHEDRV